MDDDLVEVRVEVMVNFEGLRRGWTGNVDLTERIEKLVGNGYLRLLGHVEPPVRAPVVPQALTPAEPPAVRPKRSAAKPKAATTPAQGVGGDGDSPGDI